MPAENRTYVEDVDRTLYDVHDATDPARYLDAGLTPDIVREISAKKDDACSCTLLSAFAFSSAALAMISGAGSCTCFCDMINSLISLQSAST